MYNLVLERDCGRHGREQFFGCFANQRHQVETAVGQGASLGTPITIFEASGGDRNDSSATFGNDAGSPSRSLAALTAFSLLAFRSRSRSAKPASRTSRSRAPGGGGSVTRLTRRTDMLSAICGSGRAAYQRRWSPDSRPPAAYVLRLCV
jgi:hypothetical protein